MQSPTKKKGFCYVSIINIISFQIALVLGLSGRFTAMIG